MLVFAVSPLQADPMIPESGNVIEAETPPKTQTPIPLMRLNNQSIEEFLAAHPPQNLRETPAPAVENNRHKMEFRLTVRDGVIAGLILLFVVVTVILRKKRKADPGKVQPKQEKSKEDLNLSEEERKAIEQSESKSTALNEKNYWRYVLRIFIYPLQGHVIFATIGGTIFFTMMYVAMFVPFYGLIIAIMFFCYLAACMVSIIETAVTVEREDTFDWPDFMSWFDWIGKALLLMMSWAICYGPPVAYLLHFKQPDPLFFALVVIGGFIAPMYTLAVALVGGFSSLNIINIFKSIGRTFFPYLLTVILAMLIGILNLLIHRIPLTGIPVWGGVVRWFIFVYFLFVNMRLLGLFYKAHRLKLQWYGEDE